MKFDIRRKYIMHLFLILLSMFAVYPIGNYLLNFAGDYGVIKMFFFFLIVLYLADNIWEDVLEV